MEEPPLIPPEQFVVQFNDQQETGRYRTALDPLAMLAWHTVTRDTDTSPFLITGI